MYAEVMAQLHTFFTFALDEDKKSASLPGRFIRGDISFGIHWTRRWVGLIAGLDAVGKRTIVCSCRE
jgi:hypothetical protein